VETRDTATYITEASSRDKNLGDNQGFEVGNVLDFLAVGVQLAFVLGSFFVNLYVLKLEGKLRSELSIYVVSKIIKDHAGKI
jgi:hypothetical protein